LEIVDAAAIPWGENLAAQRSDGMAHKRLFEGKEGSPDNYLLVLANESATYFSPRHRHVWDQVRYCVEGAVPIGKGIAVEAGEVAYFPEGAAYGPQEGGPDRIELLLQFGGASGQGYIGVDRLIAARKEMAAFGRFEKGVFTRTDGSGRKNQDAYEAIWEHVTGCPIAYPSPAYKAPVIARPDAIAWQPEPAPGLMKKVVGLFPHRGLGIAFVRIEADRSWTCSAEPSLRLLFVTLGEGTIGAERYRRQTTIRLAPGEAAAVAAATASEFLVLVIAPIHSLCR
jgi:hypothetical protein